MQWENIEYTKYSLFTVYNLNTRKVVGKHRLYDETCLFFGTNYIYNINIVAGKVELLKINQETDFKEAIPLNLYDGLSE